MPPGKEKQVERLRKSCQSLMACRSNLKARKMAGTACASASEAAERSCGQSFSGLRGHVALRLAGPFLGGDRQTNSDRGRSCQASKKADPEDAESELAELTLVEVGDLEKVQQVMPDPCWRGS